MKPGQRLLILLLLLTSCVSHRTKEALDQAEALLSDSPDSSWAIIDGIPRDELSTRSIRARHSLLTIMAQDKCYVDVVEDSTIRVAYDWYKRHGSKLDYLKASYYYGVILQNADNYIEAAICFREAEQLAERLGEFRWKSLCDQHLCAIFASNFDTVRALSYAEMSFDAAMAAGDSLMALYCKWDIANQFIADYRFDEAERVLNQLLTVSQDHQDFSSYVYKSLARASLLKKNPDYDTAEKCYKMIVERDACSLTSQDYGYLAYLSERENDTRQADEYCQLALESMGTATDSVTVFSIISRLYDLRGDLLKSNDYIKKSNDIQNRVVTTLLEQSVSHGMESYFEERVELEKERSRSQRYLSFLVGLVLFLFIFSLGYELKNSRQRIIEDMATLQDFAEDLKRQRDQNKEISAVVDSFIEDKIQSLKNLADTYFSWEYESVRQREKRKGRDTKEEIVSTFREQLGKIRDNQSFISSLERSLNLSDNNIVARARALFREDQNVEIELLILFFSGFSVKSICYLRRMTEAAVRMRKTRFKHFFETLPDGLGEEFLRKLGY